MANIQTKIRKTTKAPPPKRASFLANPKFLIFYAIASIALLTLSVFYWSFLGAKVQMGNADQLVSPFLFQHFNTFQNAVFPGQHTFLVKWPLFFLIKVFGYSNATFIAFTVAIVLATVGFLAAILYKIEKRLLYFGTICLALAAVLLLVPAQPYAGGLLPVNMAMLTTRNLEYILFIGALFLVVRSPRIKSWRFIFSVLLLSLLAASDKLFLLISLGGSLLALVVYALAQKWLFVSLSVKWLAATLVAAILSTGALWFISAIGLTHIANQASSGPFGAVHSLKDLILGTIYAVSGLLTNFGANPAYNATIVRNIPDQAFRGIFSLSGLSYLINFIVFAIGIYVVYRLVSASIRQDQNRKETTPDFSSGLSITLIWSMIASIFLFVVSNHYYAVDARYLTIAVFSLFISAATFSRRFNWEPKRIVLVGGVLLISIGFGVVGSTRLYNSDQTALKTINDRNNTISQILKQHPVSDLVGDYWRVVPTKLVAKSTLTVTPQSSCLQSQTGLSSKTWQPSLENNSFAYLLTLKGSLTNYQGCTLSQVIKGYGKPNESTLVSGTLDSPNELLLFYDHGVRRSSPVTQSSVSDEPATVIPTSLDQLPNTQCSGPTIMNIVAHQDDDLLFMNPDLSTDINLGRCIRTVYVTAGDAGSGSFYWLNRQKGSEAAYSNMIATDTIWVNRIVKISNQEFVNVANPQGNSKISLIFMNLPDGDVNGQGFPATKYQSLAKLFSGKINLIQSIDGQSQYNSTQLVNAISSLMLTYKPSEIRTQANFVSKTYPDHSDHMTVGKFVKLAYARYETQQYNGLVTIPLKFYVGYPIHGLPQNVFGNALKTKTATFLTYAKFDQGICSINKQCILSSTYNIYLGRQYQNTY